MTASYDAIIIGAGQAGPPLAVRFAKEGKRVAVVERNLFGGTCVDRKSTRLNSSHITPSRMPSSA